MLEALNRILELQSQWSSANTPAMEERGQIVRRDLPALVSRKVRHSSNRWSVAGRDATGRKSEIPWVRIFDPSTSPNATIGWYLVYLFDAPGDLVWLSLNQGTTSWINGEFQSRPVVELRERVAWAREQLGAMTRGTESSVALNARRSSLGAQYEAGNVAAMRYERANMPSEGQLVLDLMRMLTLLERVLESSAVAFDEPGEQAPDLALAVGLVEEAASVRRRRLFRISAEERVAIEHRAVEVTGAHLGSLGFKVRDVGATESYDLHATRDRKTLLVEVKGTVGDGSEVILTRNEVALHRLRFPNTMLAVVSRITLAREPVLASGGELRTIHPWHPEPDLLSPLAYSYQVPYFD